MTFEVKRPPFALYPEERHWWSYNDYGAVLGVMDALRPRRVLEFGPGNSTLALIEGGAAHVDCCEDNPVWFNVYKERLRPHPVRFVAYEWGDPLQILQIDGERYDMALIDGPHGWERRRAVLAYCVERCCAVLMPTEDLAYGTQLRYAIQEIAQPRNCAIDWIHSGPLSGAFALITPPGPA